jgi:hypothetical protein
VLAGVGPARASFADDRCGSDEILVLDVFGPPDLFQQLLRQEDLARSPHHGAEQVVFDGRQRDGSIAHRHGPVRAVQQHIADTQPLAGLKPRGGGARPAQQRDHVRQQHPGLHRLA